MKKDMPLEGLRWSRDSGSALYDTPQTAVLGRAGGHLWKAPMGRMQSLPIIKKTYSQFLWNVRQPSRRSSTSGAKSWAIKTPQ